MSLEQKPIQFNKEVFKGNFKNELERYISSAEKLGPPIYTKGEGYAGKQEENLKLELDRYMKPLVSLTIDALKLSNKKEEILEIISQLFFDIEVDQKPDYENPTGYMESSFFKKVILEVLK